MTLYSCAELDTERLTLCGFERRDLKAYSQLLTDHSTRPFMIGKGPVNSITIWLRFQRNRWASWFGNSYYWSVRLKSEATFVGFIALYGAKTTVPALSYAIAPNWRRRGFAREAIGAVVQFATRELDKSAVKARTHLENFASQKLLESMGFVSQGEIIYRNSKRLQFVLECSEH